MDLGKLKPHINSKKIPKKPTQKLKLSTFIFNLLREENCRAGEGQNATFMEMVWV